ncbi:MAG: thioredoxin domain-containing protein [Methanolinea sp.]|jgi:uncharacterized protein YyaL (SSP411 family)|nr:thioredoxin domain-containing protein [Methanolinea sp.]
MAEGKNRSRGDPAPNRLIKEASPYLRQHAYDPVDWYPWGDEAFFRAREEDRPIFLSIGYATCHWCHVMQKESFSDPEVGRFLNENFVCIKLDREERPDLDQYYMDACIAFTGRGGWPLSLFLTPEGVPFFATSFIPRTRMAGSYGIFEVLAAIAAYWKEHHDDALALARDISANIAHARDHACTGPLPADAADTVYNHLVSIHDSRNGGFGPPPRFPMFPVHLFLLRYGTVLRRTGPIRLSCQTLLSMARGGVYDQLGGGFHRYATDERWLVPHFEKMLYDQALAALAYSEAFSLTGNAALGRVARGCMKYICRNLQAPGGGFYAGEDADSGGGEGLFYVWTRDEIESLLSPEEKEIASLVFSLDGEESPGPAGIRNSRKAGVLSLSRQPPEAARILGMAAGDVERVLETLKEKLLSARNKKPHPPRDTLVLADWNGLAISALSVTSRALGDTEFLAAARRAAELVLGPLRSPDGGIYHRWTAGDVAIPGMSADYASMTMGLLDLFLASREPRFLSAAIDFEEYHFQNFWDKEKGGYFRTREDQRDVPVRQKDFLDNSIPSSNSLSFSALVRLHILTGDDSYLGRAGQIAGYYPPLVRQYPSSCTMFLAGHLVAEGQSGTVVVTGDETDPLYVRMLEVLDRNYTPFVLPVAQGREHGAGEICRLLPWCAIFAGENRAPRAHVCLGKSCQNPRTDAGSLESFLKGYMPGKQ